MRILLDQDQVICKWVERVLEWYNEDHGTKFTVDDVENYWALETILGPQGKPFIRSCMRWPEFYTRLDAVPGAIAGIMTLMAKGHEVRIVSAVPKSAGIAYHGKCQWIRDNMPFFNLDCFYAVHKKDEVVGDILLDDGPHNIDAFKKKGIAVVFDCPWNRKTEGQYRVKNWKEFLELVDKLQHEIDVQNAVARNGT